MITRDTNPTSAPRKTLLAVDDDLVSLRLVESVLKREGYNVLGCRSVAEAIACLDRNGTSEIECVVTDYRMPERDGLDLLRHIQQRDPTLATIILTGEGDKELVTKSLREGAADFLDKPLNIQLLRFVVSKGIAETIERRRLETSDTAAEKVGQTQSQLLGLSALREVPHIKICYEPQYQAGGDFLGHYDRGSKGYCFLAADVSGHDLRAAYLSAFFQGMVRGMFEKHASLQEIMRFFNRFLVRDWNANSANGAQSLGLEASIAVCAVTVDRTRGQITVLNQGFPTPLLVRANGEASWLGEANPPLGWFEECNHEDFTTNINPGDQLYLWSDGLEDQALALQIPCPTLAVRLLNVTSTSEKRRLLESQPDDVLVAKLDLKPTPSLPPSSGFEPLLAQKYRGSDIPRIDDHQELWEKALLEAVPQIEEGICYNILLALRESVLNAMQHGCLGHESETCEVQLLHHPGAGLIRAWVRDCGIGLSKDLIEEGGKPFSDNEAMERHCGLVLIKTLPDSADWTENGTLLRMDFLLHSKTSSTPTFMPQPGSASDFTPPASTTFLNLTPSDSYGHI